MTDNEIIKALDRCGYLKDCADCPLSGIEGTDKCKHLLYINALDLINRLQAENKRLERDLAFAETISRARHNKIEKLSGKVVASIAEIEERDAMLMQQSEIIKRLEQSAKEKADEIERLEAEIDRQGHILNSYALQYGTVVDKNKLLKEAKAEAVREFAERLGDKIITKKAETSDYWTNNVKSYRAMQGYADIEHDTDNFLRGYNEAVEDAISIMEEMEKEIHEAD